MFFNALRTLYPLANEETAQGLLRTSLSRDFTELEQEIRATKAYQDTRLNLFGVNIVPNHQPEVSDEPESDHDDEEPENNSASSSSEE